MFNYSQPIHNIIFLTRQEAEAYILPPSSQVFLMDKDSPTFYIKSTDNLGQSTLTEYTFTQKEPPAPQEYVTKSDWESFKEELRALIDSKPDSTGGTQSNG